MRQRYKRIRLKFQMIIDKLIMLTLPIGDMLKCHEKKYYNW